MRVALLSYVEPVAGEPFGLRGDLRVGGRSLARHQLGLALALGCMRIIVVAEALTSEVVDLQRLAEAKGARFHLAASAHALLPLVSAEDDLIVLADGLLVLPKLAHGLLDEAPAVLALPIDAGLAAGFERIDINHAFAGAMRLPGRMVAALADLPSEWSPQAALLRIAVQGRVALHLLPDHALGAGRWQLVRSEDEAHHAEPLWLREHTASEHARSPGEWIAARTVETIGPALLHAGTRPVVVALGGAVALLLGIGSGWFGWCTPGFALLALAWLQGRVSGLLVRIERQSLLEPIGRMSTGLWYEALIDVGLVLLMAWRSDAARIAGVPLTVVWFAPLMLMALLHYLPRVVPERRSTWWLRDRLVAGFALAGTSAALPFDTTLRLGALALIGWAIAITPLVANRDLTRR